MTTSTRALLVGLCTATILTADTTTAQQTAAPLSSVTLPAGFSADVFAENVENARTMVRGPQAEVAREATSARVHFPFTPTAGDQRSET